MLTVAMLLFFVVACSTDANDVPSGTQENPTETAEDDEEGTPTDDTMDMGVSLAPNGCQNVVIINNFAYAACGEGIEIVALESLERSFLESVADDITGDSDLNLLFTQSGRELRMLDVSNPMEPLEVTRITTNFGIFSGIAAANGILVVSGGTGGSDTQVYTYTSTSLNLRNNGIPSVDNVTGNPDVHMTANPNGGATAFYTQDLGAVENWGIQPVTFNGDGSIGNIPPVVVLVPRRFTGSFGAPFGPANFPTQSQFLDNRLYVAHFGAPGIHIINLEDENSLDLVSFTYEPTNIGTDGSLLFVVGVTQPNIDVFNPVSNTVVDQIPASLEQAIGIAASEGYIAVADRTLGLVVLER